MNSPVKLGVDDIVKITIAVADSVGVVGQIDFKNPTISGILKVFSMLGVVREFGDVDYAALLPEIEDLDEAEAAQLVAAFNGHLHITQPTIETAIEAGYAILVKAIQGVQLFAQVYADVKALVPVQPAA